MRCGGEQTIGGTPLPLLKITIKPSLLLSFLVSFSTRQLGALVINLSPSRLKGLFPGKTGPTKAMHMAFEVARDVSMAPVVIYIDECDQVNTRLSGTIPGAGARC